MSIRYLLLLFLVLMGTRTPLYAQAPAPTPTPLPLSRVLMDMRPANWERVVDQARIGTLANVLRYSSGQLEHQVFQGNFTANTNDDRLAIFSDDGCTVIINDNVVLARETKHKPCLA